jgi:hypothetical protein
MTVIWLAFGIYIIGVAIVLYIRPGIMFAENGGAWKEFGLSNKGSYTIFPFWLFSVIWAFLSYTFATMIALLLTSLALRSMPSNNMSQFVPNNFPRGENVLQNLYQNMNNDIHPISSFKPNVPVPVPVPVSAPPSVPAQMPGYYVLSNSSPGPPRYVYFGQEPPSFG